MAIEKLPRLLVEPVVVAALREDLGGLGDITSNSVVPAETSAEVVMTARQAGVIAGLDVAALAFALVDPSLVVTAHAQDGESVEPGARLITVAGAARSLLTAERVALNVVGRMSGVATLTSHYVAAVAGTLAKIADTRKTTPNLRLFEKYAVRCGGGVNHRFGLDDGVLIKDNHIAAAGGIAASVMRAKAQLGHMVKIEVEVESLHQLEEALAARVDAVLLDNMTPSQLKRCVEIVDGRAITEASGGVTLETVRAVAESGVALISSGALTHSAPNFDVALDFVRLR
jgi:nicotinate-nucleotide pyrophosphorylase (carboxylating)